MSEERDKKPGLVPRLRFPEFREAGEWEKKNLADICLRITNGKANAEDHEDDGIYPLYDRSEIVKRSSKYAFDDEAVIIPGEGMQFQPKYHKGKFNLHQRAYALMQHQGNAKFVYYTLDRFKDTLAKNAVKSTVLSLRLPIIEQFSLAVPDQKEQQKIADCLSSLDERIAAETQKLDALKTHKKGLMQQLFPAEGETVPRLRFPEFREEGEWEVYLLTDVCEINPKKSKRRDEDLVSFVPMAAVSEEGRIENSYIRVYSEVQKGYTSFVENDVIVAKITPCFENGKAALAKGLKNGIAFGSTEFHVFRAKKVCLPEFLFLQLCRDEIRTAGARSMIGNAGQRRVPVSFFETLPFYLPTIAEQQKIADFLTSLDDLIAAQAQKIELLKRHKKGLMQQLFPVLDEAAA